MLIQNYKKMLFALQEQCTDKCYKKFYKLLGFFCITFFSKSCRTPIFIAEFAENAEKSFELCVLCE